ncbi:MAG TPA: hypothetical protein PKD86_10100 [Gemmatales bacterium]|nr:hypothetical protein [Gemmatales bacterium]HMP59695.1 hypothetical protein [Gemmatales bacterium]
MSLGLGSFCLLLLLPRPVADGQPLPVEMRLQAYPAQPFFGQEVTLRAVLRWPQVPGATAITGPEGNLMASWLTAQPLHWDWVEPLDQWLLRHWVALPSFFALSDNGLGSSGLTLAGVRLRLPVQPLLEPTAIAVLEWKLIVSEPEDGQSSEIDVTPLRLLTTSGQVCQSNPLVLRPRRVPWAAAPPGVWRLGLGRVDVQAEVSRDQLPMDESLDLTLRVAGPGAERAQPPVLHRLPGFGPSAWRIERLPEARDETSRLFRYRLWPVRRAESVLPRHLACQVFDLNLEREVTWEVMLPRVSVVEVAEARPRAGALGIDWAEREPLSSGASDWFAITPRWTPLIWTLALLAWLVLVARLWSESWLRLWPRWLPRPWSQEARRALAELAGADSAPAACQSMIVAYAQQRLGLPTAQPTSAELANWLSPKLPGPLVERILELWQQCDAARFSLQEPQAPLRQEARSLLAAWEAATP